MMVCTRQEQIIAVEDLAGQFGAGDAQMRALAGSDPQGGNIRA